MLGLDPIAFWISVALALCVAFDSVIFWLEFRRPPSASETATELEQLEDCWGGITIARRRHAERQLRSEVIQARRRDGWTS